MMHTKLKYRHIAPEVHKIKYEEVKAAGSSNDSCLVKSNGKYIAFSWGTSGGGSLAVLPYDKPSRLPPSFPMIRGHHAAIIDHDFYPFNDNLIATASDDSHVKVWQIPEEFTEDLKEPVANLQGHNKKVNFVQYHPTAEHTLASASLDLTVKVWDIQKQAAALTIEGAADSFFTLEWNHNWLADSSNQ